MNWRSAKKSQDHLYATCFTQRLFIMFKDQENSQVEVPRT